MRRTATLFGCCRIAAVEPVHHRRDPRRDEHLRRVGGAHGHALHLRGLALVELRQHVVGEIAIAVAATDADPQPRKLVAKVGDHRLQAVVTAGRPARPRPHSAERQLDFVDDDEEVGDLDLEVAQQLADRLAAQVHERERLDQQRVGGAPFANQRLGGRRLEHDAAAARQLVDHLEADVVARALVFRARVAKPRDELYFFFSSFFSPSSSSFLPFLITSGSAGVAVAAAAVSVVVATSSAFGMITWTSISSASLTGVHFGLVAMSRTRTPWCSISSLTSTVMCSGMSPGRHSIAISRRMCSRTPPCCLTPFGSPLTWIGIGTCSDLALPRRWKSGWRTSWVIGSSWKSSTSTRVSPAPASFIEISVFWPASE